MKSRQGHLGIGYENQHTIVGGMKTTENCAVEDANGRGVRNDLRIDGGCQCWNAAAQLFGAGFKDNFFRLRAGGEGNHKMGGSGGFLQLRVKGNVNRTHLRESHGAVRPIGSNPTGSLWEERAQVIQFFEKFLVRSVAVAGR